jgi:S-DNA-T family DNA segregation ATPase FtsK/SpoIIIE
MFDEMYKKALGFVIEENVASISFLQRRLSIGYFRAGELIEQMEEDGYIGPFTGEISRVVYITKDQYEKLMEEENV